MRRRARLLTVVSGLSIGGACATVDQTHSTVAVTVDSVLPRPPESLRFAVDTIARGLEVPWGVAVSPDDRLFVTERVGRIRVIQGGVLAPMPWATLEVHAHYKNWGPESGLLGIALSPDFRESGHVFVLATVWRSPGDRDASLVTRAWRRLAGALSPTAGLIVKNQVIRYTERDGRGTEPTVILDDLPANHFHAGGGLAFGPDGKLYASIGDAIVPNLAEDRRVMAGKILRFEPDGSTPPGNPDPTSLVWSRGLRNTQAFAWLPDGTMLGVEHGPSGMLQEGARTGNDELNALAAGEDYGWPRVTGWSESEGSRLPVWVWASGIAPGGFAAQRASGDDSTATLFVGALRGRRIERLVLVRSAARQWRTIARDTLIGDAWGRVRTIVAGPDGSFYVTTSNRDARGQPGPADDLILRLRPNR